MIALRPPPVLGAVHRTRDAAHIESQRLEDVSEQTVHLVTPPAALLVDELGKYALGVERQRHPEVNVEILIRDREQMRAMGLRRVVSDVVVSPLYPMRAK